jgi:hypothetical protein
MRLSRRAGPAYRPARERAQAAPRCCSPGRGGRGAAARRPVQRRGARAVAGARARGPSTPARRRGGAGGGARRRSVLGSAAGPLRSSGDCRLRPPRALSPCPRRAAARPRGTRARRCCGDARRDRQHRRAHRGPEIGLSRTGELGGPIVDRHRVRPRSSVVLRLHREVDCAPGAQTGPVPRELLLRSRSRSTSGWWFAASTSARTRPPTVAGWTTSWGRRGTCAPWTSPVRCSARWLHVGPRRDPVDDLRLEGVTPSS